MVDNMFAGAGVHVGPLIKKAELVFGVVVLGMPMGVLLTLLSADLLTAQEGTVGRVRSTYYAEPTQNYPKSNLLCQSVMDGKVYAGYCWRI